MTTLHYVLGMSEDEPALDGIITFAVPIGAIVGVALNRVLNKRFTPNQVLYITDSISVLGHFFSAIFNLQTIIIGRFLQGIATGINSCLVSVYV